MHVAGRAYVNNVHKQPWTMRRNSERYVMRRRPLDDNGWKKRETSHSSLRAESNKAARVLALYNSTIRRCSELIARERCARIK
jgi:hypothetical protein